MEEEEAPTEEEMRQLLINEILNVLQLDHPNIIKFYQCIYDNQYINIIMELVKGQTLTDYIEEKGKLSEEES